MFGIIWKKHKTLAGHKNNNQVKMKRVIIILLMIPLLSHSQKRDEAEDQVEKGIALYDQGKYYDALELHENALKLDKDNLFALTEMAMTFSAIQKYDKAIEVCKLAISTHPKDNMGNIYVTYANSLDHLGQVDKSLKMFDEGLKKFPDYCPLLFNKGITLANAKRTDKAVELFQSATKCNPAHISSYNALAVLSLDNKIPAILAFSRYLVLDNQTARAKGNYNSLLKLMSSGVSKEGDKAVTISIDRATLESTKDKKAENNFSSTDMVLSMVGAKDYDDKNKDKTDCQKFIDKFETLCLSMSETKKGNKGYFWEYLAPYFIEMESKKLVEPFAYIVFLPSQSSDVLKYHQDHANDIQKFNDWSENYNWN
jgi:tetratricopeptide (TPR) repeat protein